jgi:hypothetical protein
VFESRATAISFEAANPRHGHEWKLFERVKVPAGKVLIPGVIESKTNYIEHPDLVAERIAVSTYREIIKYFGQDDPTSRTMLEAILTQEEEHADELADLLFAVEPGTDSNTRQLYFADEIPGHSEAGQEVHP